MASYNVSLFKKAMAINRANRQRERNAMRAQQNAAVIGQIGNAVTGLVGAYGQRQEMEKDKAAAAALGAQFGLDPTTATAIGPRELARAHLQMRMAQQQSPTDAAQADYYSAQAARERWLMTPEGIEATRRSSGYAPKDYTDEHIALGMDPKKALAFKDIAPPSSAVYPKASGGVSGLKTKVDENHPLAKLGIEPGEYELDQSLVSTLFSQGSINERTDKSNQVRQGLAQEASNLKMMSMRTKDAKDRAALEAMANAKALEAGIDIAKIEADLLKTGVTEGFVDPYTSEQRGGELVGALKQLLDEFRAGRTAGGATGQQAQQGRTLTRSQLRASYAKEGAAEKGYSIQEYADLMKQNGFTLVD